MFAAMSFHGLGAQIQQRGYFLGTLAFSQQLSDFTFPNRQSGQAGRFIAGDDMPLSRNPAKTRSLTRGVKNSALALQGFDGGDEIAGGVRIFSTKAAGPASSASRMT